MHPGEATPIAGKLPEAAVTAGEASAVPLLRDYVLYAGAWWVPGVGGMGQGPAAR